MIFYRIWGVHCLEKRRRRGVERGCAPADRLAGRRDVRRPREVAGPHRFLPIVSPCQNYFCTAVMTALVVNLVESSIDQAREMQSSRHVGCSASRKTHETRPQQQLLRRSAGPSSPALLLPLLLLADKPARTLGWMHIPGNPVGVQVGHGPSTAPASPVLSLGMLHRAVRRQRIKRSSSLLAGTTGAGLEGALLKAPAGEGALDVQARGAAGRRINSGRARKGASTTRSGVSGPIGGTTAGSDRVKQQIKQLGRQGMWKEALEQLEGEGSKGIHPVSPNPSRA